MKSLLAKIKKILRDRRTRQFLTRFVSVTAAIVVFVTTYALVLPAITMEREANCGIPAHQHDDSCYEEVLVCGLEESDDHQHTADCYEKKLICGLEAHTHSAACYSDEISAGNEENEGVGAVRSLTGAVSGNEKVFTTNTGGFGGTNAAAEGRIQNSDGNDYEENGDADSSETDGLLENNNEFLETGRLSNNADTALNDSQEDPETASTDDQEFHSAQIADSEETEYSGEENNTATDTASENDTVTDDDIAEGNDATEETAIEDTDPTAAKNLNDDSETRVSSEGDEAGANSGENVNANTYVPALEPVAFNTVLTSSTGIYYYHKDPEADAETDAETDADTDDKTTPVTSAEITDWKPVEEDTILAPEDLIRVYLCYSVPAGKLNETNNVARYRLPENLVLSEEQVTAINKAENGISAQYMDYATLEIKDPAAHEESLGIEAIEGTRTPDQDVEEYLAGISTSVGDAREYISAVVKVENIYETDDTDERYEGATSDYENGDHAGNGEDGSNGSTWLGQELIFTFTPYTVEKNRHKYDSSGQLTKAGQEVDGWLALDFNMDQVKWVETDRDVQIEDHVLESESEDEENTDPSVEKADNIAEAPADPADADIDSDSTISGTNSEQLSDNKSEELNNENPDVRKSSKTVRTATTIRKEAEIVFVEKVEEDRENNIEAIDEISTKLILAENFFEETEASAEDAASGNSADKNADKDSADKDEAITADDEPKSETGKTLDNKTAVAMPAAVFDDSITVRSGSLSSDTQDTELDDTTITVHVEADEDTFPAGTRMVLGTVSDKQMESISSAVEEAVAKDENISNKTRGFHAVDISFRDADGNEIEPLKPIRVSMKSDEIRRAVEDNNTAPVVVHVSDPADTKERSEDDSKNGSEERKSKEDTPLVANVIETIETTEGLNQTKESSDAREAENRDSSDTLSFESDSFSIYAVVYTVDFHYEINDKMYDFSIPGGGIVTLQQLVEVLGIADDDAYGENASDGADNGSVSLEEEYIAGEKNGLDDTNDTGAYEEGEDAKIESTGDTDTQVQPQTVLTLADVQISDKAREFVENVQNVEFSNPALLWVGKAETESTVGELKETNGVECRNSAELTEEQIVEINAQIVKGGDWVLISLIPFDSEEVLTITRKDGQMITVHVTDLNENPLGLGGKSFKIVNTVYEYFSSTSYAMTAGVYSGTSNYGQRFNWNSTLSYGETWTFVYTGTDTKFLLKDSQERYLLMIPRDVANSTQGLEQGLQMTTNRELAETYPIVAREMIDSNGKRGYCLLDTSATYALAIDNNNRFYLDTAVFANNNKTNPKYCMELRDPSTTSKPGQVNTADTRADGIIINMFDYYALEWQQTGYNQWNWVDILDEEGNAYNNNGSIPNRYNIGINQNHALKFTSHGTAPSSVNNVSINNWADPSLSNNKYVSIQGVVGPALNSNGYPVLWTGNENLGYLFNGSDIEGAKTAYTDLNHLFIKDERGYYRYDSNENYAYYDSSQGDGGDFSIYAGTFNEEGSDNTKNEAVGFFPFNDYDSSHICIHGDGNGFSGYTGHQWSQTPGWYNHQFGMSLEASFVMTPDGKYLGDDIVFNFSGDDDLWVFVDGVLVLDIGGIHNPVAGEINFNSGDVTVKDEVHGGTPEQLVVKGSKAGPSTIKEAFERVTGKEWDDSPYSRHKMKVFYMERGGMYSNLKISFNLPTYKTVTLEKKLEGLTEKQLEKYKDEYFYYQVNITDPDHPDTPVPYNGPYGVLTRPATSAELADWIPEYKEINGENVYVGGKWREDTGHSNTETINKNGELVRWSIQVDNGIVRVKPGWYFTIEELAQGEKFTVAELYGYPPAGHTFHDGEEDDPTPDSDLMEPFFAPTAEYTYYDPEDVFHREPLSLNEEVNVDDRKAWRSGTKELKYSDWIYFTNTLPLKVEVEKVWTDREGNVVTHTEDPINYKIYRIPYQIVPDDDPENETHEKRVDYPVEELVKTAEEAGPGKVYIPSMEGYTGLLTYNSEHPDQSWKELVTQLPRVGQYTPAGETDPITVLYEYYITEETHVDGYKHFIEGGEITDDEDPDYGNYSYVIKNKPLSSTDQQTRIDVKKEWEGGTDDLHKDDSVVFQVTQKKYVAAAKFTENGNTVTKRLYPITINLVDEGGTAGHPRVTTTRVVYVPEGASLTLTPQYHDQQHGDQYHESEHVVSVGGVGITAGSTTNGVSPRTITQTSVGAPSNTFYYPNSPQVTFTFSNVDSAKEVTLWLYAGNDLWVKLYDALHPEVNYIDKSDPNQSPNYHRWTCGLSSNKDIIWDIQEVLENIVPGQTTNQNNPSNPVETTPYHYTMRLTGSSDSGLPTVFTNGVGAPGYAEGDDETVWQGSITELPFYEFEGTDNLSYIYTYDVTEAQIGSNAVTIEPVYGTETPPVLYNGQTSQYLVKWQETVNWDEEVDGTSQFLKFTNKLKETTEVSALKKWVNPDGDPMAPPEDAAVTFELFADDVATGKTVVLNGTTIAAQIAAIDADPDMTEEEKAAAKAPLQALTFGELTTAWKAEWKDLPKYNYAQITEIPETAPAQTPNVPIVYTIKETVTYFGYENMNPDGVGDNGEITNKQLKFSLKIVKVDANDAETALSGAKFQLTRKLPGESSFTKFEHDDFEVEAENDNKRTGPFTVDSTEGVILEGLIPGEYQIREMVAPDGYISTLQLYTFTLATNGSVTSSDSDNPLVVPLLKNGDDPAGLQIGNNPGAALPSTGGTGTNLFYLIGCILMMLAGEGIVMKRRKEEEA